MLQKNRSVFIEKLLSCITAILLVCGVLFALPLLKVVNVDAEGTTVDVSDTLTMEDWSATIGEKDNTCIVVKNNGNYLYAKSGICVYWNDHASSASANAGCDIMEYVYINGVSAREAVTKNATEKKYVSDSFPFSMNGVYAPIAIETVGSGMGLYIKVMTEYAPYETLTVTLKAGFTLIDNNNDVLTLTEDVTYCSTASGFIEYNEYTLSFDGTEETVTVRGGDAISAELPAITEREGYIGAWTVGGVVITSDTLYTFGEDAQAIIEYRVITYYVTIERVNGTQDRIEFNIENRAEKLLEIKPTQANKEYVYSFEESIPNELELTDYTFTEVQTVAPPSTKIVSQSLTVGTAFSMNIYVEVIGQVPQMRFTMKERSVTVDGSLADESTNKYVYTFEGIAADQLADSFTATVLEGEEAVDSLQYSVEAYLLALSETEIDGTLKTLIADIVAYAQAAEEKIERTEKGIQTISGLVPSAYSELTASDFEKSVSTDETVEIASVGVVYTGENKIVFRFVAASTEKLTVKINGETVEFTPVEEGNVVYEARSDAIYANGGDNVYTVTLLIGDSVVQTASYSIKSYAYQMQNSEDTLAADYAKALYNYNLSLKAYEQGGAQ